MMFIQITNKTRFKFHNCSMRFYRNNFPIVFLVNDRLI
nr:MAG TPA: hypothetical protein [Caudoviricetes sp.]